MFLSKIFLFVVLVNQVLQISSEVSCGKDTGPAFEPLPFNKFLAGSVSKYNLPWTVKVFCTKFNGLHSYMAIISEKHALASNRQYMCTTEFMEMRYYSSSGTPLTNKVQSMAEIKGARHLLLITGKEKFQLGERTNPVCLPHPGDSYLDFVGQYIYGFAMSSWYRSKVTKGKVECSSKSDVTFCSYNKGVWMHMVGQGAPGTVVRDGRHVLLGFAVKTTEGGLSISYVDVMKYVEAIRKQMYEDGDKPSSPKSGSGKSSPIYDVVNKHANK